LVSLRSRGKYQGFISLAIGIGAAAGPFVAAGLIQMGTDGWRWAFWVPAIMGGVCFVLLVLFLPLKPVSGSFKEKVRKIDWWGVMAAIAGIVLTVVSASRLQSRHYSDYDDIRCPSTQEEACGHGRMPKPFLSSRLASSCC
jgi:MFS family permease